MELGVLYDMRNPPSSGIGRAELYAETLEHIEAVEGARLRHGVAHGAPLHRRRVPTVGTADGRRRRRPHDARHDRYRGAVVAAARPVPRGRGRRRRGRAVERAVPTRPRPRLQAGGVRGVRRRSPSSSVAARGRHRDHPWCVGRRRRSATTAGTGPSTIWTSRRSRSNGRGPRSGSPAVRRFRCGAPHRWATASSWWAAPTCTASTSTPMPRPVATIPPGCASYAFTYPSHDPVGDNRRLGRPRRLSDGELRPVVRDGGRPAVGQDVSAGRR